MFDNDDIFLLDVNPELAAAGFVTHAAQAPGYGRVYRAAIDGRFPTTRTGRRLSIRRADLPLVAAVFGLVPTSAASAPRALVESAV